LAVLKKFPVSGSFLQRPQAWPASSHAGAGLNCPLKVGIL
jgi:hypothetical protein